MLKRFYGYIRVSTNRQGEGASLPQQRDDILRYAKVHGIEIVRWFEERRSAATPGRPAFNEMLRLLRTGQVEGVIIHKTDRSARNRHDWAYLLDLPDQGINVRVATDNLDLSSTSDRLTADVHAAMAVHYIRNLREEVKKGMYGRLKQGLLPLAAPVGYLDRGGGKPKDPDPIRGPMVTRLFELYATGRYSLASLTIETRRLGLTSRHGRAISFNALSVILNNPFYVGIIRLRSGETFSGIHKPIVCRSTFDRVQRVLRGRTVSKTTVHEHLFRRLFTCTACGRSLTGEVQKGSVYYRCHSRECLGVCVREEMLDAAVRRALADLAMDERYFTFVVERLQSLLQDDVREAAQRIESLRLSRSHVDDRIKRLTDAYIDRMIDKGTFEQRNSELVFERRRLDEQLAAGQPLLETQEESVRTMFELAKTASLLYEIGTLENRRDLVKIATSNRTVGQENVVVELSFPFSLIAQCCQVHQGGPDRDEVRTTSALNKIIEWSRTAEDQAATIRSLLAAVPGKRPRHPRSPRRPRFVRVKKTRRGSLHRRPS